MASSWINHDFQSFWKFYAAAAEWPLKCEEFLAKEDFCPRAYEFLTSADDQVRLQEAATKTIEMLQVSIEHQNLEEDDEVVDEDYAEDYAEDYDEENAEDYEEFYEEEDEMVCEGDVLGDEAEMTPEMLEFVQITQKHRQELAEKRAAEAKLQIEKSVEEKADDYVMADTIGVHGAQKPTTSAPTQNSKEQMEKLRNRQLYGLSTMQIEQQEAELHTRFERLLSLTSATMWPNIPLRFN
ncbi:hypothetical protein M3Y98_00768400 [Aphelenchoides besseyi]|nr:hypothetical protein M3Y98_00768400 [Aphelenchoides besseyi]KAI6211711.1 hypothetical protein M3Y96_00463200 [Aphelenchoides besseyi]